VWLLFLSLIVPGRSVGAADVSLLTFGTGKTQVRIYSDYLCGACGKLEPRLDAALKDLVKKNKVSLTFVDTPTHRQSPLFARYFLYILNEKKDFEHALKMRALLFEAVKMGVADKPQLEEFLAAREVKYKAFDVTPVFKTLEGYIRDDKVARTPTAVILSGEKKESHDGAEPIIKALNAIK
jgi:protein-disulfide isomerase